jgi:probable F420-dependent oxidoreductase
VLPRWIKPEHLRAPAARQKERRQDLDRRCLAGAVWSEQREQLTRRNVEADATERLHVGTPFTLAKFLADLVGPRELRDLDRGHGPTLVIRPGGLNSPSAAAPIWLRVGRMPQVAVHLWERDPTALARLAAQAEQLGYAQISVGDHVSPGLLPPFMACAVIASATSAIRFGPLVLNNDFRNPVLVAQQSAGLSRWSGGRFELALGSGYNRREYAWLGLSFAPKRVRAERLGESAEIIRRLLNGKVVDFQGEHYTINEANLGEPPPHVPLLIGGNSRAVLTTAALHADVATLPGYSPGTSENSYGSEAVTAQREFLEANRPQDSAPLELHVLAQYQEITADRPAALQRAAEELQTTPEAVASSPFVLAGTVEQIAAQIIEQSGKLGITRWTIFGDRPGIDGLTAYAPLTQLVHA